MDSVRVAAEAFSGATWTVEDVVAEGDTVAARYVTRFKHDRRSFGVEPTGREVTIHWNTIYRVRDGKIVEIKFATDFLAMYRQIGRIQLDIR